MKISKYVSQAAPKIFCAGLDIMEMVKPDPTRCRNFWLSLQDMWNTLYTYRLPTVALINVNAFRYEKLMIWSGWIGF